MPTIRKNIPLPSSWSQCKPSKKPAISKRQDTLKIFTFTEPHVTESQLLYDGGLISSSWRQAPWDSWPVFFKLNTCSYSPYVTSSLTRGRVCYLNCCWPSSSQSFSGPSPSGLMSTFYCLRFETPPTWKTRSRRYNSRDHIFIITAVITFGDSILNVSWEAESPYRGSRWM
jgi:hypothetical protein